MQIDVVSDTVCPWCFIGKRRLDRALAMRPDVPVRVFWRPYRLDPTIPREGVDRRAYLRAKFGDGPRNSAMADALRQEGASEGITFAFDKIAKTPNTLDSHRLIRWAGSAGDGVQNEIVERVFQAYFLDGRDIGDTGVLTDVAKDGGMDAELVGDLLGKDADLALVEREAGMANQMGISGVPTFIFNSRFMISGAREAEILVKIIDKAWEAEQQPSQTPS
ncbi:MAG: DsbA family oxidoreductase [Alphaproteobacteria bacterium]|nr:DsbA family oxidoreductase [Alphaproteobacteria bacterium]MBV9420862.1 DsbA family oxidoreductase [Alphaproteobacteria bacterium]MBV9542012.1 DsbA family oxidoreductase [Alphaproteobacteria bacterium]